MLVLTRKVGEQIVVSGDIRITIVAIRGDRVRLGITAPSETVIDRREIHERRIAQQPPNRRRQQSRAIFEAHGRAYILDTDTMTPEQLNQELTELVTGARRI